MTRLTLWSKVAACVVVLGAAWWLVLKIEAVENFLCAHPVVDHTFVTSMMVASAMLFLALCFYSDTGRFMFLDLLTGQEPPKRHLTTSELNASLLRSYPKNTFRQK